MRNNSIVVTGAKKSTSHGSFCLPGKFSGPRVMTWEFTLSLAKAKISYIIFFPLKEKIIEVWYDFPIAFIYLDIYIPLSPTKHSPFLHFICTTTHNNPLGWEIMTGPKDHLAHFRDWVGIWTWVSEILAWHCNQWAGFHNMNLVFLTVRFTSFPRFTGLLLWAELMNLHLRHLFFSEEKDSIPPVYESFPTCKSFDWKYCKNQCHNLICKISTWMVTCTMQILLCAWMLCSWMGSVDLLLIPSLWTERTWFSASIQKEATDVSLLAKVL